MCHVFLFYSIQWGNRFGEGINGEGKSVLMKYEHNREGYESLFVCGEGATTVVGRPKFTNDTQMVKNITVCMIQSVA